MAANGGTVAVVRAIPAQEPHSVAQKEGSAAQKEASNSLKELQRVAPTEVNAALKALRLLLASLNRMRTNPRGNLRVPPGLIIAFRQQRAVLAAALRRLILQIQDGVNSLSLPEQTCHEAVCAIQKQFRGVRAASKKFCLQPWIYQEGQTLRNKAAQLRELLQTMQLPPDSIPIPSESAAGERVIYQHGRSVPTFSSNHRRRKVPILRRRHPAWIS